MSRLVLAPLLAALVVSGSAQTPAPGQPAPPQTPARAMPMRDRPTTGSAVLRGQVVEAAAGTPLRRAIIRVFAPELRGEARSAMTDAEGRFEIRELPAGKYTVSAERVGYLRTTYGQRRPNAPVIPLEILDRQVVDKVVLRMARGGVISGRVLDEFGEPALNVDVRAMQYRFESGRRRLVPAYGSGPAVRTDDLGGFRLYGLEAGQFYVSARPNDAMFGASAAPPDSMGSTATFFPNTVDVATAQRVTVAAGRETSNVNIVLATTRLSNLRGRAIMSNGEPFAGTFVNVTVRDDAGSYGRSSGMTQADGSFEVKGLTPGTYELVVRPFNAREDDDVDVGRLKVTVSGDDIDGLLIVGGKPAIARGRIVADEAVPLPYSQMNVNAIPASPEDRRFVPPARVRDDQTFELKGLFGAHRLGWYGTAMPTAPDTNPWVLKAVIWNGTDIIDTPIDFQPGQVVEGLELVVTRRLGEISGQVTTGRGAAPPETWIVLFPAAEERWTQQTRFLRVVRPDPQGQYRFRSLPAHDDYLIVAVPELEPGQHADPEFLRSVRDQATPVSLGEGEKRTQDLRVQQLR